MDTKKQNERLARFLGYGIREHFGQLVYHSGYTPVWNISRWTPHTDLNQLFQVVDKIMEKAGVISYGGMSDEGKYYWLFETRPVIHTEGPTRQEAIYTACIAALDHLQYDPFTGDLESYPNTLVKKISSLELL